MGQPPRKKVWRLLKKLRITIGPSNFTSGYIATKELKAEYRRDICTAVFIAALFAMAKRWKPPKCPFMMSR